MMVASEWMILKMEIEELRRMTEKETENREKKRNLCSSTGIDAGAGRLWAEAGGKGYKGRDNRGRDQRQRQQRQKRTAHRMSYLTGRQISPWTVKW